MSAADGHNARYKREEEKWKNRRLKAAASHILKDRPGGWRGAALRRAWCGFESHDSSDFDGVRNSDFSEHQLACKACREALIARPPVERSRPVSERGPHLGFKAQPLCGQPAGAASIHIDEGECPLCLVEADSMFEQGYLKLDEKGLLVDLTEPSAAANVDTFTITKTVTRLP